MSALAEKLNDSVVHIETDDVSLEGNLTVPDGAQGLVLFAHGSGSSRHSPRNRYVAGVLHEGGLATLLFDLLTEEEERIDRQTRHLRFDIDLLAKRLTGATEWVRTNSKTRDLNIGYFGSSTGAAAALIAAAQNPDIVHAVVSRGGRPDLAKKVLPTVQASTLLIVGGNDLPVISMNREAQEQMETTTEMEIIPGAGHLFEGPGQLEEVARLARDWFNQHLSDGLR